MIRHDNWLSIRRGAFVIIASASLAGCGTAEGDERAAIERDILNAENGGELFAVIKQEYPDEIGDLVTQIQAAPMAERGEELGQELGAQWLQAFMTRIGPDAVKAPAETLLVWSAAEAELYETLQRGAQAECSAMTMGEWVILDDDNAAALSAIVRRNSAMIRSAAAGRDNPQAYREPSEAELNEFGNSIADTGIDPDLQAVLGLIPEMEALPVADQCALGVAFYRGIANLPDDAEPIIAAYMLSPD